MRPWAARSSGVLLRPSQPGAGARSVVQRVAAPARTDDIVDVEASAPPPPPPPSSATGHAEFTRFSVPRPADADAARFALDPSVAYWANFTTRWSWSALGGRDDAAAAAGEGAAAQVNAFARRLAAEALTDATSAAYWAYHLGRTAFFVGEGIAGLAAHHAYETFVARDAKPAGEGASSTPLQKIGANAGSELSNRLAEGFGMYQQDLAAVRAGEYALPWDMTTLSHRQYNPLYILRNTALFVSEAVATLSRRVRASTDTKPWLTAPAGGPQGTTASMYPDYYLNAFHYQSDGWLSARSAQVYEFSTETLFFGRQDAMQRTALRPMAAHLAGRDTRGLALLEVACGTGRFHTYIKDNYPGMASTALDLSPYYLAQARDNLAYWARVRGRDAAGGGPVGGTDGTGTTFVQARAEATGLPDAAYDVVTLTYLFHELPEEVRRAVAGEMHRVLKPGGLLVFTDSVQRGDRPEWDANIGAFSALNEPYYANYIQCDLGALFADAGFVPGTKYVASASKTLSFTKPL